MAEGPTNRDPSLLNPELGDCVTIVYQHSKKLTGYIIYRDAALIRIRPEYVINMAHDFPLDPETGAFLPEASVSELIMHEKAADYHFAVQLGVFPGDRLEFYQVDGTPMNDGGEITQVIATEEEDKIVLSDGRILDFQFLGVPPPIGVIMPTSAQEAEPENNEADPDAEAVEEPTADEQFPDIDDVDAINLVEEIPTSEVTYSDSIQREAMFVDLLIDVPVSKQKDPRVLRNLYRKTDILLALKNSVVVRNEVGTIVPGESRSYLAKSVQEALAKQPVKIPLAALLPVAAVKKVLYLDKVNDEDETGVGVDELNYDDVDVRRDIASLAPLTTAAANWLQVLNDTLNQTPAYVAATQATEQVGTDHDVLRTRIPGEPVQGFRSGLFSSKVVMGEPGNKHGVPLTADFVQTVDERSARLLAPTFIADPVSRQRIQITAGDSAATVAHVMLTRDLAEYRTPTRSSILLWDVLASEKSRARTKAFYTLLTDAIEKQTVISADAAPVSIADELCKRVSPSLNYMSRSVLGAVDSLGLKTLEFDSDIMNCLATAVQKGCEMWDRTFQQLLQRARESLESNEIAPLHPLSDSGASPLWDASVKENADIRAALETLQGRETTLFPTATAKAAFLFFEANQTLSALWFRLASKATDEAVAAATKTYRAERVRLERNQLNKQAENAKLTAQPVLNPCLHVHELEVIMNVRSDARRMKLLRRFVDRMKAGVQDNWIICGVCDQHLICKHEILLMEEFNHPGRGDKLHKSLLLDFAAPVVFEGAYICKNCGQKISELEYDTHMEFDDEGRPMVGRTTLEEEDAPAAELETLETSEDDELPIVLKEGTKEYNELHALIRTIVEYCGIIALPEIMDRIQSAVVAYMEKTVKSANVYNAARQKAIEGAKTEKLRQQLDKQIAEYKVYLPTKKISIAAAFVVLEILTQKTAIPFPAVGCKFERGGYPLTQTDDGVFKYVSCVVASIIKKTDLWMDTEWSKMTDLAARQVVVMNKVKAELKAVVETAASSPSVEAYKVALDGVLNAEVVQKDLPSMFDRLPLQFRPIPNPDLASAPAKDAIQNANKFQKDLETASVTEIAPYVKERQQQVLQLSLKSLHASPVVPRRLAEVAAVGTGLGSMQSKNTIKETELLEEAEAILRHRDPAASCCGTHIMVPWSAPGYTSEMATPDSDTYYRLFLKHCFRGSNVGRVHEFDSHVTSSENTRGHRCRHCDFIYPEALTWLTMANISETNSRKLEAIIAELAAKRKEISLQAFVEQQVVINEQTFHELEDTIRLFKNVVAPTVPSTPTVLSDLEAMHSVLRIAPVLPSAMDEFMQFTQIMNKLYNTVDPVQREGGIAAFARTFNTLADYFASTLRYHKVENAEEVMTLFAAMTEDMVGAQAARNVLNLIVVQAEKIANNGYTPVVFPTKWIPGISASHKTMVEAIWNNESEFVKEAVKELADMRDEHRDAIRNVLGRFSEWMGAWMQFWINSLRAAPNFNELESRYFLRWSVLTGFISLTNPLSPLLNTYTESTLSAAVPFLVRAFSDMVRRFAGMSKNYLMTPQQIEDAIHDRREREKRFFIKHFDDMDNELRKIELINKKLGLGFFSEAKAKAGRYDATIFEIETSRMSEMGIDDFTKMERRRQRQADIGNDHRDRAIEDA